MIELASDRDEIQRLPRTLLEAIEAFEEDELSYEVFGDEFIKEYVATKHTEWEQDHLPVSEAERTQHLPYY
jgi:glutamine synthetase